MFSSSSITNIKNTIYAFTILKGYHDRQLANLESTVKESARCD